MGKKSSNHGKHGGSFFDSSFDRTIASFLEFMFFEHFVAKEEENEDADEWRFTLTDESIRYGVSPWDYDTEEEFIDALVEASLREIEKSKLDALSEEDLQVLEEYGIVLKDFTLDELQTKISELLAWRESISFDDSSMAFDLGIDPEDYIREEDFYDALKSELSWRDYISAEDEEDALMLGVDIEDYVYESDFQQALEDAREEENDNTSAHVRSYQPEIPPEEKPLFEKALAYAATLDWNLNLDDYRDPESLYDMLAYIKDDEQFAVHFQKACGLDLPYDGYVKALAIAKLLEKDRSSFEDDHQFDSFIISIVKEEEQVRDIEKNSPSSYAREAAEMLRYTKYENYEFCDTPKEIKEWRQEVHRYEVILGFAELKYDDQFNSAWDASEVLKAKLYERFYSQYPDVLKDIQKSSFSDIGRRAAKSKSTKHLPLEMFSYLSSLIKDTRDTEIIDLISYSGSKEYCEYMVEHVSVLCQVLSAHEYSVDEIISLTDVISALFMDEKICAVRESVLLCDSLLEQCSESKGRKAIAEEIEYILERLKEELFYRIDGEICEMLGQICQKLPLNKKQLEAFNAAMEKVNIFKEVKTFSDALLTDGEKDYYYGLEWKSADDAVYQLFDLCLDQHNHLPIEKLQMLLDCGNLSQFQMQLIPAGIIPLALSNKFFSENLIDDLFLFCKKESGIRTLLLKQPDSAALLGKICAFAFCLGEVDGFEQYLRLFLQEYSVLDSPRSFFDTLAKTIGRWRWHQSAETERCRITLLDAVHRVGEMDDGCQARSQISPEERKQLHFSEQKELLLSLLGKMIITKDQYNHCIRDLMLETGIDEDIT